MLWGRVHWLPRPDSTLLLTVALGQEPSLSVTVRRLVTTCLLWHSFGRNLNYFQLFCPFQRLTSNFFTSFLTHAPGLGRF